jgi:hypothetical protein
MAENGVAMSFHPADESDRAGLHDVPLFVEYSIEHPATA